MKYNTWSKKKKTLFHVVMVSLIIILSVIFSAVEDEEVLTVLSLIYMGIFILETVVIVMAIKNKKEIKNKKAIEDNKPTFKSFIESAPYNHENWLRVFGYKREFTVVDDVDVFAIENKGLTINYEASELHVHVNELMIGKLADKDLMDHLNNYWNDDEYDVVPVLQEINYKTRVAKIQINFFKQIKLEDNPKVKVIHSKLVKVDENQHTIESQSAGTYLKVYRDDEKTNTFYVTDKYGETLGEVKKDVAKLVDEYFDNGFVIARLKEVIDEVDHTAALVEFYFIQRNV